MKLTDAERLKKARAILNKWMNDIIFDHDALLSLYDLIVEKEGEK